MKFWKQLSEASVSSIRMIPSGIQAKAAPEAGEDALIARAAELCNPFFDTLGEVTLTVCGPIASSVLNWNAAIFTPILQPVLMEVVAQAFGGGSFEITAIDCSLDAALPNALRSRSRDGGRRVIQGLLAPRGDRVIERYRSAVLTGNSPGHLAVIHALRASLFHLPPRLMIAAYLLQEGVGAGLDDREIARFLIGGIIGASAESPGFGALLAGC